MEHQQANKSSQKEQTKETPSSSSLQPKSQQTTLHPILQLQRTIGNQSVQRLLNSGKVQTKLNVGQPGDIHEQEANQMAQHVVTSPPGNAHPIISTNSISDKGSSAPPIVNEVLSSDGGRPLDSSVRAPMEAHLGQDFSQVRVHTDGQSADSAKSINALAYTVGSDIVFGSGQYAPETTYGKKLLAHELTHVVQQSSGHAQLNRAPNLKEAVVQRQEKTIDVEIVEIPQSDLSVGDIVEETFHHTMSILDGYHQAIEDFQTIVNAASAKQAIPKGVGEIALEQVGKFVVKQLKDIVFDHFPYAKKINEIAEVGITILEEIEKEKKRAEEAGTSNQLGQFVVKQGRDIVKMHRAVDDNWISIKNDTEKKYAQLSDSAKKPFRDELVRVDNAAAKLAKMSTAEALFQIMAEKWIAENKSAYVFIRLDKDWKVVTAHIHAPRGQQLAEQLLRDGNGRVKLNDLKVYRRVEFFPQDLTWVYADFDAQNNMVPGTLGFNIFGEKYFQTFATNISKLGIPETTVLTGD